MTIDLYSTEEETVKTIPVATAAGDAKRELILRLPTGVLNMGQIVDISATFQVTNPYHYPVSLSRYFAFCQQQPDNTFSPWQKIPPAPQGTNTDAQMHHQSVHMGGKYKILKTGYYLFGVFVYCASVNAAPGDTQTLENHGLLQVLAL